MKAFASLFLIVVLISGVGLLAGCAANPTPTPTPIDPACSTTNLNGCTSEICTIGGPDLIFGVEEVGLAAAMIKFPVISVPLRTAYLQIQAIEQQPGLTWGQLVAGATAAATADISSQWGPLIIVLLNRFGSFTASTPVSSCDLLFLQQNAANVLAMSAGVAAPHKRHVQSKL